MQIDVLDRLSQALGEHVIALIASAANASPYVSFEEVYAYLPVPEE